MKIEPEKFWTRDQVGERFQIVPTTLANWAVRHRGPRFVRFGNGRGCIVRYAESELQKWAADPAGYELEAWGKTAKRNARRQKAGG